MCSSCIMSSVALEELRNKRARRMHLYRSLHLSLKATNFNTKPELQTGGMDFGHLPSRGSQMKDATELHYGKCRTWCFQSSIYMRD